MCSLFHNRLSSIKLQSVNILSRMDEYNRYFFHVYCILYFDVIKLHGSTSKCFWRHNFLLEINIHCIIY